MTVVALVLAAGSSRRMGRPKALLPIDDETFLARIVRVLLEGGATSVSVVVGGEHREEIEAAARVLPGAVSVIENDDPSDGPVSSVRRGIASNAQAEGFLIHPVDVPGVAPGDVRALIEASGDVSREDADAFVPSVDMRRGHPLLLRAGFARRLVTGAGRELPSVRALLAEPGVHLEYVLRENRGLLRDFDTPADLGRLGGAEDQSG